MKSVFIGQVVQWLNFWLVLVIALVIVLGELTSVDVAKRLSDRSLVADVSEKKPTKTTPSFSSINNEFPLGKIYQRENIFNIEPLSEPEPSVSIASLSLPKMKDLVLPPARPAPKVVKKINIIDPLNITINGVITCDDFSKNLCMISDSSGKEQMYKVGDLIETSTIVSIATSGVSLVRPNGQIETFCLGVSADFIANDGLWSKVVDPSNVEIDYKKLEAKISSFGELIQELGLNPCYNGTALEGFVVAASSPVVKEFGLAEGDIITMVENLPLASLESRVEVYNKLTAMDYGSSFTVLVKRGEQSLSICYKLQRMDNSVETAGASDKKDVADKKIEVRGGAMEKPSQTQGGMVKAHGQQEPKIEFVEILQPEESFNQYYKNIEEIKKRLAERIKGGGLIITGAA